MRVVVAAFALVLIALGAACDGDDEDATPSETPASPTAVATSTAERSPTPPAGESAALTYVSEGAIWIADPPAAPQRFADIAPCGRFPRLDWSPDGELLACHSGGEEPPARFVIWDAEGALLHERDLAPTRSRTLVRWSPDGTALALEIGGSITFFDRSGTQIEEVAPVGDAGLGAAIDLTSPLWSQSGNRFAFWAGNLSAPLAYSIDDASASALPIAGRPMAWVLDDQAVLVAENYVPAEGLEIPQYEVRLVYLDGRDDFQRRPELDNGRQFWLSPDRRTLAFLTSDLAISFMDIATGEVTPVSASSLNYPSEGIPPDNVRFTEDGLALIWADVDLAPSTINRAEVSSGSFEQLFEVEGLPSLSPDARRVYFTVNEGGTSSYVANVDGSGQVLLTPPASGGSVAWRPSPE